MEVDAELDTTGLVCPLPVLKARRRLKDLAGGQVLRLVATDPAAAVDVPQFCAEAGYLLIGQTEMGGALHFLIQKSG